MRLFTMLALSIADGHHDLCPALVKQVFPGANPAMPFSAAVKADGLIYVSGTLGSGGDVKAQTKQVLDNISATLKTAGSSLANAASVTVYLRNQSDFAGDERGLPRLLDQGSAGAHHGDGAAAQRRARRDRRRRRPRRRRARRRQPERVGVVAESRTATGSRPATRCSCRG